ncbi:MAG TPA: hypothetical protein VI278_10170 [Nitrososphaeraceae archaeon]|jgi:hypothetical protein
MMGDGLAEDCVDVTTNVITNDKKMMLTNNHFHIIISQVVD